MMNNENGRSMVEMLGVLAIIGVLSVAGILGYTIAMRKYRANEIAHAISIMVSAMQTTNSDFTNGLSYTTLIDGASLPSGVDSLSATDEHTIVLETDVGNADLCNEVERLFGDDSSRAIYVYANDCDDDEKLTIKVK